MVKYNKLLNELSAMEDTLKKQMATLRGSKSSRGARNASVNKLCVSAKANPGECTTNFLMDRSRVTMQLTNVGLVGQADKGNTHFLEQDSSGYPSKNTTQGFEPLQYIGMTEKANTLENNNKNQLPPEQEQQAAQPLPRQMQASPLTAMQEQFLAVEDPLLSPLPDFQDPFESRPLSPQPRAKTVSPSSSVASIQASGSLHRACQLFPKVKQVIEIAMCGDPTAASTSVQIEQRSNTSSDKPTKRRERYTYPINIALMHRASPDVVEMLANAAPNVEVLPDGRDGHTSLGIVLHTFSRPGSPDEEDSLCLHLVDILLQGNARSASIVADRRHNYPLHVACSKGASLEVVERLYQAFPGVIAKRNVSGETPLMIAQRHSACREDVLDFLQSKTWR